MDSKKFFKFTDPNGKIQSDVSLFKEDAEYYDKLVKMKSSFYARQSFYEKTWRNSELDLTDKLLQVDSTYGGKQMSGSEEYRDILSYRYALRSYSTDSEKVRPTRPSWYKG